MGDLNEFLANFHFYTWLSSAVNLVLMLAVAHWFPWSFHLGHKLTRYWAFASGCLSIILAFGLWALMEGKVTAWFYLLAIILLIHWLPWKLPWLYSPRLPRPVAYGLASLPVLAVFAARAVGAGDYTALIALGGLYGAGGLATLAFYHLDRMGLNEFERKNSNH